MRLLAESLVSEFPWIGRKPETNGNEIGNGEETRRSFLYRFGNERISQTGNDGPFLWVVRLRKGRRRAVFRCSGPS